MAEPFLGEVRIWGLDFAPRGWAFCHGQTLAISQNTALFSLVGTQFGGDGRTTFAVPELRSRVPMHPDGSSVRQGLRAGTETVTLTEGQMPVHRHGVNATSGSGSENAPAGHIFAGSDADSYLGSGNPVAMEPNSMSNTGGSQPHTNMQPTLALTFTIALEGLYPSRN
jgi:microcystin-dependent protein